MPDRPVVTAAESSAVVQNRMLASHINELLDVLHEIRVYTAELNNRTGAAIDPATVASVLGQIVDGFAPKRPCPTCEARAARLREDVEYLIGLAGMRRVTG